LWCVGERSRLGQQRPGGGVEVTSSLGRPHRIIQDFPTTLNTNDIHVFIIDETIFTNISVVDGTHHRTLSGWLTAVSRIWPSPWPTRNTAGPGPGPYGRRPALQGGSQCRLITMPKKNLRHCQRYRVVRCSVLRSRIPCRVQEYYEILWTLQAFRSPLLIEITKWTV